MARMMLSISKIDNSADALLILTSNDGLSAHMFLTPEEQLKVIRQLDETIEKAWFQERRKLYQEIAALKLDRKLLFILVIAFAVINIMYMIGL